MIGINLGINHKKGPRESGGPFPGILGLNSIGATEVIHSGGEYPCSIFTPTNAGSVTALNIYTGNAYVDGPINAKFCIYSKHGTANRPLNLLYQVNTVLSGLIGVKGWHSQAASFAFSAGVPLFIGFWSSQHYYAEYTADAAVKTVRKWGGVTYPTLQDPYTGSNISSENQILSIFADVLYTP